MRPSLRPFGWSLTLILASCATASPTSHVAARSTSPATSTTTASAQPELPLPQSSAQPILPGSPTTAAPTLAPGLVTPLLNGAQGLSGTLSVPPAAELANSSTGLAPANGSTLLTDNGAAILASNGSALVSTNGSTLLTDNGAAVVAAAGAYHVASFGLLDLAQTSPSGISISLAGSDGKSLTNEVVKTDARGNFTLTRVPTAPRPWFARADFNAAGTPVTFAAVVPAAASSNVAIDATSTLVTAKVVSLLSSGQITSQALADATVSALETKVRANLDASNLPFMGRSSEDLVATVDQLVQDVPAVQSAARALAPAAAAPAEAWQVTTVLQKTDLEALGFSYTTEPLHSINARFEVDDSGNFYLFSKSAAGLAIVKRTPAGMVSSYASLPASATDEALDMCFGPDGVLYASYIDRAHMQAALLTKQGDQMVQVGTLVDATMLHGVDASDIQINGRMAVDGSGNVYAALGNLGIVVKLAKGEQKSTIYLGKLYQSGDVDGPAATARFDNPRGLALGPDGALYVADAGNLSLRRVDTKTNTVTTFAGRAPGAVADAGASAAYRNGRGLAAQFGVIDMATFGPNGDLYICGGQRVRRISKDGSTFLVAGGGAHGIIDGTGSGASFSNARFLLADHQGNLYVRDDETDAVSSVVKDARIRMLRPIAATK